MQTCATTTTTTITIVAAADIISIINLLCYYKPFSPILCMAK
jgi:hypothetical protein